MIVGIDIGTSNTDIVGFKNNKIIKPLTIKGIDPVASASGALGKFLTEIDGKLEDITAIYATGVGVSHVGNKIFNIALKKVDEFTAIGYGGAFLVKKQKVVVINMGTGTAIVEKDKDKITHLGGTGLGGGSLIGLSKLLAKKTDIKELIKSAKKGKSEKIDLQIGDVFQKRNIGCLTKNMTVSNFGKILDSSNESDILAAIVNMVCEVTATMADFAARLSQVDEVIFTGKVSKGIVFDRLLELSKNRFKKKFIRPELADYSTAIGAALQSKYQKL